MSQLSKIFGLAVLAATMNLSAATITYTYLAGSGNTLQNANISFTFGAGTLKVDVENLVDDPNSVLQGISGINFTIAGGLTGTLVSQSGQLITIVDGGTYSNTAGTPTWTQKTGFDTSVFGGGQPKNVILGGPGAGNLYSNGNGSITGATHNPFVKEILTLNYTVAGATASSALASLFINFNTSVGLVPVTDCCRIPGNEVPEPTTYGLIGGTLIGLRLLRRRK